MDEIFERKGIRRYLSLELNCHIMLLYKISFYELTLTLLSRWFRSTREYERDWEAEAPTGGQGNENYCRFLNLIYKISIDNFPIKKKYLFHIEN